MVKKPTNPPRHFRKAAGFSWLQASGLNGLLQLPCPGLIPCPQFGVPTSRYQFLSEFYKQLKEAVTQLGRKGALLEGNHRAHIIKQNMKTRSWAKEKEARGS